MSKPLHASKAASQTAKAQCRHFTIGKGVFTLLVLVAVALLVESFVFNFRFFESAHYSEENPTAVSPAKAQVGGGTYDFAQKNSTVEFRFASVEVNNIRVVNRSTENLSVAVYLQDEGNVNFYEVGTCECDASTTEYIRLHAAGDVSAVKLVVLGADSLKTCPVGISFNVPVPYSFDLLRTVLVLAFLLVVYSVLFNKSFRVSPVKRRHVVAATAVAVAGVCLLVYYAHTPLSQQASHEHQYFELAVALSQGHVYLDAVPSEGLMGLSNPYDTGLREAEGVDFLWDHAYYEGRYYVYFGLLPALLYHLPWYLATGTELPNWVGVMCSCVLFVVGAAYLLCALSKKTGKELSVSLWCGLFAAVLFVSNMVDACCGPDLYCLPIVTALAASVWGIAFWVRATTPVGGLRLGFGVAGSACMASLFLIRPQVLLLCFVGIPLIIPSLKRESTRASALKHLAVVLVPFVIFAAIAGAYNFARFGSPFDYGANYNLTNNDMTVRGWNVDRTVNGVLACLFQPYAFTFSPIGSQVLSLPVSYYGTTIIGPLPGGVLLVAPVLLLIPLWLCCKRADESKLRFGCICLLVIAFAIIIIDVNVAGTYARYYIDFGGALGMALLFSAFYAYNPDVVLEEARLSSGKRDLVLLHEELFGAALAITCFFSFLWLYVKLLL